MIHTPLHSSINGFGFIIQIQQISTQHSISVCHIVFLLVFWLLVTSAHCSLLTPHQQDSAMLIQRLRCIAIILAAMCLIPVILYQTYPLQISTSVFSAHLHPSVPSPSVRKSADAESNMPKNNVSVTVGGGPTVPASTASTAPTFVHQSWKTKELPPRFVRWFATWEICFPGYDHRLWTDDDNLELVRTRMPDFLDQYIRYKNKIQRADSVRYMYLYFYGGIYSDLDNECLRSFQHLIDNSGCGVILGSMRSNRQRQYIQNSFMYSRPGHPFWLKVVEAMMERQSMTGVTEQDTVDLTTGPKLLMHAVSQHKKAYEGTKSPGPICVFPDTYFNPYSWDLDKSGPCKDLNQMSEADLANCKRKHKLAYVIQYHTQSWFAGKV